MYTKGIKKREKKNKMLEIAFSVIGILATVNDDHFTQGLSDYYQGLSEDSLS